MTVEEKIEMFLEWAKDRDIPDPEHYPKTFEYMVNLFKYYHLKDEKNNLHNQ